MPLIEHLAQTQFKYTKLFEDQAATLRNHPVLYQKAYDNVSNSEGIGQPWMPKADEKDAYLRYLEDICCMEPKTADEGVSPIFSGCYTHGLSLLRRMKICFAAHAFLACLIWFDIGQLSSKDQLKVIKRFTELQTAELANLPSAFMPPPLRPEPDLPALQIHVPTQMHRLTQKKLRAFLKNPLDLLGKRFMLKGSGYEIVRFGTSKGRGHCYGVQYADCVSAVEMDGDELKLHLQESYLIDG